MDQASPANPGPPKWLNSKFIENAIKKDFAVKSLKIEEAVCAGENYATIVYRTEADTTVGPLSFIVKCIPENEFRAQLVKDNNFMSREIRMYDKTLKLLDSDTIHLNYPHCQFVQKDSVCETLVLRDMRPLGYRTSPRQAGLDAAHCRLALTQLAHLHGLSAALRIQQPKLFETEIKDHYKELMYTEDQREKSEAFMHSLFPTMADSVRYNLPFRFKEISKIMDRMMHTAFDELKNDINEAHLPENQDKLEDRVLVLNHGDFWSNNMLFQYKEGSNTPVACAMIDFQVARYASPSLDLQYFFYSSTTQATRHAHMDELLQLYLDEANKALRSKGVTDAGKKFYKSVTEIKEDIRLHSNFGFLFSCVVLPIVIADKSKAPDLNEVTEESLTNPDENPFRNLYSGPLFVKRFTELLEDFDDLGYFKARASAGN